MEAPECRNRSVRACVSRLWATLASASRRCASIKGTSSGRGMATRRASCSWALRSFDSRMRVSASICRVSISNNGLPGAILSPTRTKTRATTPDRCDPIEMFSVRGSTIPVPATVCSKLLRGGSMTGSVFGIGCCRAVMCWTVRPTIAKAMRGGFTALSGRQRNRWLGFHPSPSMKHHAFDFVGAAIATRVMLGRPSAVRRLQPSGESE